MNHIRVSDLARSLGTTTTTIYNHIKKLGNGISAHVVKEGGITLITQDGVGILKASIQTTTIVASENQPQVALQPMGNVDFSPVTKRMDALEAGFLELAKEMGRSQKEMVSEIRELRQENATLRDQVMLLAAPKQDESLFEVLKRSPEPTKVWSPQPKPDPLTGASWFTKQWVRLVDPVRLRRWDS